MLSTTKISDEIGRKAVAALHSIEIASQRINQILTMIEGITSQSGILASRRKDKVSKVSEVSQAFAAIAFEVQALMLHSSDAAQEIKELISISGLDIEGSAQLSLETGTSLQKIIERVTEINSVVAQIAASAEQQALGLQEVDMAIGQMDNNAQQTAFLVEQASEATRSLILQSGTLARVVARFTAAAEGAITRVLKSTTATPKPSKHDSLICLKSNKGCEEI